MITLGQDSSISTSRAYVQKTNTVQINVVCQNAIPHTEHIISSAFPSALYNWNEDVMAVAVMNEDRIDIAMPKTILSQYGFDDGSDYTKDITAFKAWLADMTAAGTPVQVCYKLATPIAITLDPEKVVALSGVNNLYSDTGDTTVAATISGWETISDFSSTTDVIQNQLMSVGINAEEALAMAEANSKRINDAQLIIDSLQATISTLITGQNGESLMTQTDTGWTFSLATIQNTLNTISNNVNNLNSSTSDMNNVINTLNSSVNDLGVYTDYIKFGVDNGKPCIILGETDSAFKVLITNTDIRFMEGSTIPASISNQALNIGTAVIQNELRQGGFSWAVRSNGNYGLSWKGVE